MLKQPYHRSEKLRALARGQPCMVADVFDRDLMPWPARHDPATVVWAHSNLPEHGKGKSIKAHDCFGFLACAECHAEIDQGTRLARPARQHIQREAMKLTRVYLIACGHILGAGVREVEDDAAWLEGWRSGRIRLA